MKKFLISFFVVVMCLTSLAQTIDRQRPQGVIYGEAEKAIPIWDQIAEPFVATDIYGNTVDLGAILESGKSVLIDYSCCWCEPCWNVHSSGVLDAVDAMEDVQVIWVEIEEGNSIDQIYGVSGTTLSTITWGDWTVTPNGEPIEYPIIDDRGCLSTCESLYEGFVPSIYFIAPNGYFCDIYGKSFGLYPSNHATTVNNIQKLIEDYPRPGVAPVISLNGTESAYIGTPTDFDVTIASFDPITSIEWTLEGATPSTATGEEVTCVWSENGVFTVTVAVSNDYGTTTGSLDVEVYSMNNPLTYTDGPWEINMGTGYPGYTVMWGAMFPANVVKNVNTIDWVQMYFSADSPGQYEAMIYQGGDNSPEELIGSKALNLALESSGYVEFSFNEPIQFDNKKNLWVVVRSSLSWPMSASSFCGDRNGGWLCIDGSYWNNILDYGQNLTWMLRCGVNGILGTATLDATKSLAYPNPTSGIVNVEADNLQYIEVLDNTGRVLMTERNNVVNISELGKGVYFLRIVTNEGISVQSVVKD
ncbi:MAG: T9SS type A sorting domain-containing protein [Candidatus Limimorpha sp.]